MRCKAHFDILNHTGQRVVPRHRLVRRTPAKAEDLVELIEIRATLYQGLCAHHLGKDTADAPHVDRGSVACFPEEDFGRTVPACYDAVCVFSFCGFSGFAADGGRFLVDSGKAKVGYFQDAVVID